MGRAIAEKLSSEGYRLMLFARSEAVLELADKLGQKAIQGDISNKKDLKALVDHTVETYGRVDDLVVSTGHPAKGPLLELEDKQWEAGMELVLMNVVRLCRLLTPELIKNRGGVITLISSFAAKEPSLDFPISSVMRSALASYVKLYSQTYARVGIRINGLLPGYIDSYQQSEKVIESIPAERLGKVEEVAATVSFLHSDGAAYINGQNIVVDGGSSKHL